MKTTTGRKIITNTPHTSIDGRKEAFCPLCIYQNEEVNVIFDYKSKSWICPRCKYVIPHHLDPVETRVLSAGNNEETGQAYCKTITFHQFKQNKVKPDKYSNPMDAWNSD